MNQKFHIPVMPKETIRLLNIKPKGIYIDGTLGGGGHASLIAKKLNSSGYLIGIDQDIDALKFAKNRLKRYHIHKFFIHDNFQNLSKILHKLRINKVDGILLDLGISTYQLESPHRGFSFKNTDDDSLRLDMRMDSEQTLSAYEVVNCYDEERLRNILYQLGEEPFAKSIAHQIILRRMGKPIKTPKDLLSVIKSATPPKYRFSRRDHWASKVFRAIRMEVNQELPTLETVIPQAVTCLKKGGRLVIISFHSLEDRIVKHNFRALAIRQPQEFQVLTKKPLRPTAGEIVENPKADSAKLRVIEKLENLKNKPWN